MSSIEPGQQYNIKQARHVEVITVDHATDDVVVIWYPAPASPTTGEPATTRGYPGVFERDVFEKLTGWAPPDPDPMFALASPDGDDWKFEPSWRVTPTDELRARHEAQRRGVYFVKYAPVEVTFYRRDDLIDTPPGAEVNHIVPPQYATFLCELDRDVNVGPSSKFASLRFIEQEITCSACIVAWRERAGDPPAPMVTEVALPPLATDWQNTVAEMVRLHAYVLEHGLQKPVELANQPIDRLRYLRDNHETEVQQLVDDGRPEDIVCAVCRQLGQHPRLRRVLELPITESSDDSLDAAEAQIQVIKGGTVTKLTAEAQSFLRSVLSENRALAFLSVQSQEFVVRLNLAFPDGDDKPPTSAQRVGRDDIRQSIAEWLHGLEGSPGTPLNDRPGGAICNGKRIDRADLPLGYLIDHEGRTNCPVHHDIDDEAGLDRTCTCDGRPLLDGDHLPSCPQYVEPF